MAVYHFSSSHIYTNETTIGITPTSKEKPPCDIFFINTQYPSKPPIKIFENVALNKRVDWTPTTQEFESWLGPYDTVFTNCTFQYRTSSGDIIRTETAGMLMFTVHFASEDIDPVINSITPSDANGYYEQYGVFLTEKSSLNLLISASGSYNSFLTYVGLKVDGIGTKDIKNDAFMTTSIEDILVNPISMGSFTSEGTKSIGAVARNSRGLYLDTGDSTYYIPITSVEVHEYVKPTLYFQSVRWDIDLAQENDNSTTVRLICSGTIPDINDQLVSGTITVQGRQKNTEIWTLIGTVSVSGTFEEIFTITNQSEDYIYEYKATLVDSLDTSVTITDTVGKSTPIMDWDSGGKGIGIMTVAPKDGLNIGTNLHVVGNMEDGYSRIQISDPDNNNSTVLANLDGDTLQLLTRVLGIDRAFIGSHLFLDNNVALGGLTTAGAQTPILCMNASNQVELNWTSSGLKGRVTKEIWTGTVSKGGTITIPELPYYNLIAARLNTSNELVYSYRPQMVKDLGTWYLGHAEISGNVNGGFWIMGATFQTTSPTTLNLKWAAAYNNTTFYSEYNVTAVYGIL